MWLLSWTFGRSVDSGDGAALVGAMIDEMRDLYEGLDLLSPDMPKAGVVELGPPHGTFLVGYRDGDAICGGGVKRLPDGACVRGAICAGAGCGADSAARVGGCRARARLRRVRLDTGPRQPHARGLYESEGYVAIGNFNGNPVATFFGEKRLAD